MLMNKILRYSFVALLAMMVGNVMAQDVTLDFTLETEEGSKQSVWGFPASSKNKQVEEQSFTYNGYTVKVAGSEGNGYYWHDKDHYLLFGKQGAYVQLPAFDFDVARIEIEGTSGASTGVKQNIFVGDEAVSTETTGAKDVTNVFQIAEGYQAAGTIYTIKVTSAHNNQIRTIKIYKKGAEAPIQEPEFSVAGGLYLETQSVAMSCEEGARILYTVAVGNDPEYIDDENYVGVFYDGNPLTVSKSTIIKAMAVKNGKTSNIVTAKYTIVNTTGKGTVESPFSVADALLVIDALDNGQKTADEYVIKGSVTEVTEISLDYGNATFKIADAGSADVLTVFRAKDANGENITDENYVKVGDKVAVQGKLQKYVSGETVTPEVAQGGKILSVESEVPLPELPTVDQQPVYKFTAKGQWGSYTFNKAPFRAADYKGFRIEYSNMNEVSEGAAFNILINSNETHLGQDWSGAEAQVPNKTAYKNFGFDAAHTVFEGDFSDFVATDDPATTCPTIAQFALQACAAGNTVIIKKVVFIKQDNTEVLPEYKGDDWGGGAYTIEEVTDGINTINADKTENGVRYNLAGQKVNNGFKGVVIMNGKKMLQK